MGAGATGRHTQQLRTKIHVKPQVLVIYLNMTMIECTVRHFSF